MKKFLVIMMMLLAVGAYAVEQKIEKDDIVVYTVGRDYEVEAKSFYNSSPGIWSDKGYIKDKTIDMINVYIRYNREPLSIAERSLKNTNFYGYRVIIKSDNPNYKFYKNKLGKRINW